MIQVTTIAPQDATDRIDIPEIECLLSQEEVPAFLRPLFVTIAVRDDDWYPQETYREDGDIFMTLLFRPAEFEGDVNQLIVERFRTYLSELKEEDIRQVVRS